MASRLPSFKTLDLSLLKNVLYIRLNRPDRFNAFTVEMYNETSQALRFGMLRRALVAAGGEGCGYVVGGGRVAGKRRGARRNEEEEEEGEDGRRLPRQLTPRSVRQGRARTMCM